MKKIINKTIKIFSIISIIICIFLVNFTEKVWADVGSFESYDSGSSSWGGGSSWDSGSSWSSSSRDHSYSSGGNTVFLFGGFGDIMFWLIVVIIVIAVNVYKSKNSQKQQYDYYKRAENFRVQNLQQLEMRQTQIENKIQEEDPNFNKEEFIAWSKNLFIKLQQAWTDRDWSKIRAFETENLFEQHKNQLDGYIKNNQINVMDRICVNYAHLNAYRKEGDKEILTVRLNSRMIDYIIDATTKKVLKGEKDIELVNTYLLTFIRKNGVKTKPGTIELNTKNCPNCGAPTKITSSGECEYCGSIITTGEYNWVLSNLEREIARM